MSGTTEMGPEERARLREVAESAPHRATFNAATILALLDALEAAERERDRERESFLNWRNQNREHQLRVEAEAKVDRLTEALASEDVRLHAEWRKAEQRAERAEADLADEKRRHAELRGGVEALADRLEQGDHSCFKAWCPTCAVQKHNGYTATSLRALLSDTTTGLREDRRAELDLMQEAEASALRPGGEDRE